MRRTFVGTLDQYNKGKLLKWQKSPKKGDFMKKMTVRMAGRNIMQNQISMLNQINSPPRPSIIKDSVESSNQIDPSVRVDSSLKAPR